MVNVSFRERPDPIQVAWATDCQGIGGSRIRTGNDVVAGAGFFLLSTSGFNMKP